MGRVVVARGRCGASKLRTTAWRTCLATAALAAVGGSVMAAVAQPQAARVAALLPGKRSRHIGVVAPPCQSGSTAVAVVSVVQASRAATADRAERACSPLGEHWLLTLNAADAEMMQPGRAVADLSVTVLNHGRSIRSERATTSIVLRCLQAPAAAPGEVVADFTLIPRGPSGPIGLGRIIRATHGLTLKIAVMGLAPLNASEFYAIWLSNSQFDSKLVTVIDDRHASRGSFRTAGHLPADTRCFNFVIVSVERTRTAAAPHRVQLKGRFTLS